MLNKIYNINRDIAKRWIEYATNPLNLPESVEGGSMRDSRDGHLDKIKEMVQVLEKNTQLYTDKCGGPPPPMPSTDPTPSPVNLNPAVMNLTQLRQMMLSALGVVAAYCVANPVACGILVAVP